jgi:hypothetical protein
MSSHYPFHTRAGRPRPAAGEEGRPVTTQLTEGQAQTLEKLRLLQDLQGQEDLLPDEDRAAYEALRQEVAAVLLPLVRAAARAGLLTATVEDPAGTFLSGWRAVDVRAEDAQAAGTIRLVCRALQGGAPDTAG